LRSQPWTRIAVGPLGLDREGAVLVSNPVQLRTARPAPDCVVLSVAGEVDLATAPDLESAIAHELAAKPSRLVLDLSAVSFFGSLGLATLIRAASSADERGVRLALVAGRPVRRTMELTQTEQLFAMYVTVAEAVAA
jgi:anti-anti-sigma factor